ncbi:MAG: flagellar assembly protein FliH [Gammaproteobacteria bacterium]|nr:flagellar assembly protein FliH [Gammaproteobacteria bacterium]
MTSSKLLRADQLGERCQPWQAPEVAAPERGPGTTPADLRAAREQAWQEGFAEGRAAGLEAARKEARATAAALEKALDTLTRPLGELDHRFHDEVVELVRAVVRAVLRRELRLDPSHLVEVVREGLAALPMAATEVTVRMHPEDAAAVRGCLSPDTATRAWHIETDPLIERGGCIIHTAQSQVDGRLETRLDRTIATMFDDTRRSGDEPPGTDAGE